MSVSAVLTTHIGRWVSGSTVRGTWDIISVCLSTVVICVCSAFHGDIPRTRPENRRSVPGFFQLLRWTSVFLLLPEILPSAAIEQLREALIILWNMKHVQTKGWTLTHSFYAAAGGYAFDCQVSATNIYRYHFNLTGFLIVIEHDASLLPDISKEAITSRSQLSSLAKGLAVLQVLYFCTSCILRPVERLSLSVLEISTMGYAFCAVLAYVMWWKKPCIKAEPSLVVVDVESPLYEQISHTLNSVNGETRTRADNGINTSTSEGEVSMADVESGVEGRTAEVYPNTLPFSAKWGRAAQLCAWSFLSLLHSIFYILAWRTQLPTEFDRVVWKVSTAVAIALGPIMVHVYNTWLHDADAYVSLTGLGVSKKVVRRAYIVVMAIFVFARVCMLAEMVRELFYLSPDAFVIASWSKYLPHFS